MLFEGKSRLVHSIIIHVPIKIGLQVGELIMIFHQRAPESIHLGLAP